jgi:hypothetical protein
LIGSEGGQVGDEIAATMEPALASASACVSIAITRFGRATGRPGLSYGRSLTHARTIASTWSAEIKGCSRRNLVRIISSPMSYISHASSRRRPSRVLARDITDEVYLRSW